MKPESAVFLCQIVNLIRCIVSLPVAYGWTDMFPTEVSEGVELTLTIGYVKGSPPGRIILMVDFNPNGKIYNVFQCLDRNRE